MSKNEQMETENALMQRDIAYIREDVKAIKNALNQNYVTKDQFDPVKKVVYGLVSLILIAVIGAIMTLVLRK